MRDYPDEAPRRWYSDRYTDDPDSGGGYEGYRIPDPRYGEDSSLSRSNDPLTGDLPRPEEFGRGNSFDAFGSRPATEPGAPPAVPPPSPPPPPPAPEPERYATQQIDREALRRPQDPGGVVYRTRRAGTAALLLTAAIIAELLLFRVLLVAEFGAKGTPGGVLAGLFGLSGVPLVTMGLYGLMTGAASAGPAQSRPWARAPLAYLPVGLALLIAAGLAVG